MEGVTMKENENSKTTLKNRAGGLAAGFGLLIAGLMVFTGPEASAGKASSNNYRLTRTSINQGGQSKASATTYKMKGSVGETSYGVMSGTTRNVADGLMKIMFYPRTISDIRPSQGADEGSIKLEWTAPGADGGVVTASKYIVKYSTYPDAITDQSYFETTATLFKVAVPNAPNTQETITLTGLTPGTSYYVAIEARDADENQGDLSKSTYTWAQVTVLSVDISSDTYGFGTFTASTSTVSTSTIRVVNNGTVLSTWNLKASTITTGSPWQITDGSLSPGDLFRLSAAFHLVQPSTTAFGTEDRMTDTDAASDASSKFTINGSSTGYSVPAGEYRNFWLMLETPLSSSTSDEQQIRVTVTATPTP